MSALHLATFSEVIPFLWELFCDLCMEEAIEVQGVSRCSDIFLQKKVT